MRSLSPPRHPARLMGNRRMSELHSRARERMDRRRRLYVLVDGGHEAVARLGGKQHSLSRRMRGARVYAEHLYEQAKDLEARLWAAQPRCGVCSGTGKVKVNDYEMDCGKCSGSGREH